MTETPANLWISGMKNITDWPRLARTATHDNMFLALLSVPVILEEILRQYLRPDLVAMMADSPPEVLRGELIREGLRRSRCDLLCKIHLTSKVTPHVYVILEHKSKPDHHTVGQLKDYEDGVREADALVLEDGALSLVRIYWIVVYNGRRPWNAPRTFEQLLNLANDPKLAEPILDKTYGFIDTHRTRIRDLCRYPKGRVALALLKRPKFEKLIAELGNLPNVGVLRLQVLAYICRWYKVDKERWEQLMSVLAPLQEGWETDMNLITDVFFEEGRVEGLAEGLAEGQIKGEAGLLERRFGDIPRQERTRISKASHEQLEGWFVAGLDAESLDGVFNGKGNS